MARKRDLDVAADELTTIVERHLAKLSPKDRKARLEAFGRVTAKVREKYAKPSAPLSTATSRRGALKQA
ncbi:MAG: hypothetical protein ACRD4E_02010 [Bryobacteraceae bacterium]